MLGHPSRLATTPRDIRALLIATLGAVLALGSTACSAIAGEHEAETKFLVKPTSSATFSGWSEITLDEDPKSVDSAELMYVRLEARDNNVADLTFIKDITAETEVSGVITKVAEKAPMPPGERIVPLDRTYTGDIRDFFYANTEKGGHTIHINWHGGIDATKTIPPEGVWMKVRMAVRID